MSRSSASLRLLVVPVSIGVLEHDVRSRLAKLPSLCGPRVAQDLLKRHKEGHLVIFLEDEKIGRWVLSVLWYCTPLLPRYTLGLHVSSARHWAWRNPARSKPYHTKKYWYTSNHNLMQCAVSPLARCSLHAFRSSPAPKIAASALH